ncbi:hypothetical protein QUB67_08340 [Microcoleus sp. ARI1-A1]|uniref:hypothetical protein n=1 Tax=unclassified Microcoleus TaxID=2642155 RepID=UPI002FD4A49A
MLLPPQTLNLEAKLQSSCLFLLWLLHTYYTVVIPKLQAIALRHFLTRDRTSNPYPAATDGQSQLLSAANAEAA